MSWNVNGLRAAGRKGFLDWLGTSRAQIVGLQETKARAEQLAPDLRRPKRWHTAFHSAERPGYSGVGLYSRLRPTWVRTSLGEPRFDAEGRLQLALFGQLLVANVYFPKGSGSKRDNSRVPYKLDFYRALFDQLDQAREAGYRVLVMGDFNTAPQPIDLARPKQNRKHSGFLPEECEELQRWLDAGWVDTFRSLHPDTVRYSWWRQAFNARERNVGWRIDLVLASEAAMEFVERAFILTRVTGSDHCPVGVDLSAEVLS